MPGSRISLLISGNLAWYYRREHRSFMFRSIYFNQSGIDSQSGVWDDLGYFFTNDFGGRFGDVFS